MHKAIALIMFLGFVPLVSANPYSEILDQAVAALDKDYRSHWAFTETVARGPVVTVGQYDPTRPVEQRWQLVSIDGMNPDQGQIDSYLNRKEQERSGQGRGRRDPVAMIQRDSLVLVEETDAYWIFDFRPQGEGQDADVMTHLKGRLRINKNGPYLEHIDVHSAGAFKPRFSVKINEFAMHFEFGKAAVSGPVVPTAFEFRIDLKVMGLVNQDESIATTYSDYQFVVGKVGEKL
jgi:hypothetical protein